MSSATISSLGTNKFDRLVAEERLLVVDTLEVGVNDLAGVC